MLTDDALPHRLARTIVIQAAREVVFRYFTDSERWASWWGEGSTIDPRPGGRVFIRHPGGVESGGEIVAIEPPSRLVFTYGFMSGTPIPQGASRVTIDLEAAGAGTRLSLTHDFAEAAPRDEHVQGWRYQLSVFGNLVANELHADAAATVDTWFAAWSDPNVETRQAALARVAAPDIAFRDRFSLIDGLADLEPHLAAIHRFMPGLRLAREGAVRHCQGMVVADWVARTTAGEEKGRGTNVFLLGPNHLLHAVTGFWGRE